MLPKQAGKPTKEPTQEEMNFFDHLEELRWHILRSLIFIISAGTVIFLSKEWVFNDLIFGPTRADFWTFRQMCAASHALGIGDTLCFVPSEFNVLAVGFGETFSTHIMVAFVGGFIVAFPYVFYEFWKFIKPGLYKEEVQAARGIVFVCSSLFLLGVLFGYFIVAPFGVLFLAGYTLPGVENSPTLSSYISYLIMFSLPTGFVFELPVVSYFLTKIGLITPDFMRTYRRHAIVVISIVAAIVTPPDVVTMLLIGFPLVMLYEVSILVSQHVIKKEALNEGPKPPQIQSPS